MARSDIDCCAECLFYRSEADVSTCVRNPPSESGWPICTYSDFCGEFQKANDQCDNCEYEDGGCGLSQSKFLERNKLESIPADKRLRLVLADSRRDAFARRAKCLEFKSRKAGAKADE